jgi:cytochrome P450
VNLHHISYSTGVCRCANDSAVLRLYSSAPVNSRAAVRLTILPTGPRREITGTRSRWRDSWILYCVYAMHRLKDIYGPDALEFRPERWQGDQLRNVGWGYLPFNGRP